MKRKILAVLTALCLLCALIFSVHADFGDFGGDSDFGDFGGGFDFDSGNDYDYDSGNDYDDDYDNNGNYYYGGGTVSDNGRSDGNDSGAIIGAVFIVVVIVLIILSKKGIIGNKKSKAPIMPGAQRTNASSLNPIGSYSNLDPNFNASEFKEKLSNLYVKFQNSWQAKNMEDLRPYLTDAFYSQCDRQLDAYRKNKQTNRIERIAVLDVNLVGWKQEGGNDVMIATLRTRITDYVVNDTDGQIVRGSDKQEKFMEYEWSLVRPIGVTTTQGSGTTAQNCPNCGAHIDINKTARCEYCGSIITTDANDWAVNGIKGISQRTQ